MTSTGATRPRTGDRESDLPVHRRHRPRREWGRGVARVLCAVLALVGVLPFAAGVVIRSPWARAWAAREAQRVLKAQGVVATFEPAVRMWPLAIELERLRVESNDGGAPALECARLFVRPRLFGLLAGKILIHQIDVDQPHARLVLRDGAIANLAIESGGTSSKGPVHAPFDSFSVTDGSLDLDADGLRADARSIDLDVTAEDDRVAGSSFEIAMRAGRARVQHSRAAGGGKEETDDDALCSIDARARVEPDQVLVRRLQGVGSADLDAAPGTTPPCDLPTSDKRRVEVSLGHLHVTLPKGDRKVPSIDGHVRVRAPVGLAERAASLPETDGWIGVDLDVRYADDTILPDLAGTIEAHDLRLDQYSFAQELRSEISIRRNVVRSPTTAIRLGGGTVVLSDTVLDPFAQGAKLEHTRLDATGVDFTALLRDLGVHQNPWVGWEIHEVHAPVLSGTLGPLRIDGDFTARTSSFGVYDRPAEDRARERLVGVSEAQIAAHTAIRPDALEFQNIRVTLPRSHIEGGFVSIGFHNDLRVDVPHMVADLDDVSPIGPVALHGVVDASAHVGGKFNRPEPAGEIRSISGLTIADVAFGEVTSGHVAVDVLAPEIEITGLHAKRRDSPYDVPTAKLKIGGARGFIVDAVGSSPGFSLRDVLSMFSLEDDPRFDGLEATMSARADVHVALGGPEDPCGGGYVGVDTKGQLRQVAIYGERFAQGDADVSLRWVDRLQGLAGADIDLRSFVLDKVQPPAGTRPGATGTVLGSASLQRGGAVAANVMIQGVPLSRVDALGAFGHEVEGSVSGVAHVTGNLDDFRPGAGLVSRAELDVSGTRVRDVALPNSHLAVQLTHRLALQKRSPGRTRCGAPIGAPFDKAAYLADTASHGEWVVDGDLLGGTVRLRELTVSRARAAHVSGRLSLRGVDLGALTGVLGPPRSDSEDVVVSPTAAALTGQLWGELIVDDLPVDAPSRARVRLFLGPTVVSRARQKLTLQPPQEPLTIADDTLSTPPLHVTLDTPDGFRGGFVLSGGVTRLTSEPTLNLSAHLEPVDLAVVQRLVPKVENITGLLEGSLKVTGRASAPVISGDLHASGDEIMIRGLPTAITGAHVDVKASATEIAVSGTGKFAGGVVSFEGSVPVQGLDLGALDSRVAVRGVRLAPEDGVTAVMDADLQVTYEVKGQAGGAAALPHVTGDVTISSFSYTRPINLNANLTSLATRARRTEVDAYDPSLDFVAIDLRVRSKTPLVIKNNLVEVQLGIDSGTLDVTGTNQRVGLRGSLRTAAGGRFHFQGNDFEVRQGLIHFDDPTRIAANVDITATTEYRRYTDTSAGAAAGAGTGGTGPSAASIGSTRGGSLWRITLHAYGDADNLHVEMTSEPALSQEDIVLLLAVGMTRAELDQLGASSVGASIALNYLGAASGAEQVVKQALPIIDDFRFGSAYSTVTGKTEPQLTVGKRLANNVRATVTAGLSEDRELRSNIEWRLSNHLSVQGSYDNINDVSSSALGNVGMDLRWRLDFE